MSLSLVLALVAYQAVTAMHQMAVCAEYYLDFVLIGGCLEFQHLVVLLLQLNFKLLSHLWQFYH